MTLNLRLVDSLLDSNFIKNPGQDHSLTLFFADSSISCLMKDIHANTYTGYEKYLSDIPFIDSTLENLSETFNKLFSQNHLNPVNYSKVLIVYESNHYTLVPRSLSNRENDDLFHSFNNKPSFEAVLSKNRIHSNQLVNIYTVSKDSVHSMVKFPR